MKLSLFKKVIREVIREEIEYSIAGLRKELKEVLVSKINDDMLNETPSVAQSTKVVQKPVTESKQRVPMTKDSILNNLLKETADSGEWQNINKEAENTSVMDQTEQLPDHLANAFNKDYSGVMKAVEEKAKFKNGA
tara:strand:- start:105 stop:512 length:408 start_codon:yes stop_codon:yes gene_type:complete